MADPVYPGALPTLPTVTPTPTTTVTATPVGGKTISQRIDANAAETNAICAELGINPAGVAETVAERLDLIDESVATIEDLLVDAAGEDASLPARLTRIEGEIGGFMFVDVQDFQGEGTHTWIKPDGAIYVDEIAISPGGGGGSGGCSVSAVRSGAASGGPGRIVKRRLRAADLPSSDSIVIGAPGVGAASVTGESFGLTGSAGGNVVSAGLTIPGGAGGGGGNAGNPTTPAAVASSCSDGSELFASGAAGTGGFGAGTGPAALTRLAPTGGGGGGHRQSTSTQSAGGPGGAFASAILGPTTGAAGGAAGAPGAPGAAGVAVDVIGTGGGGGGASATGAGGRGGDGGGFGSAGGGGGSGTTASGPGGNAAPGRVIRVTYCVRPS